MVCKSCKQIQVECLLTFAIYLDTKKTEEKFAQIVVDPETAAIVQNIFKLFVDGMGITAIVRYLNDNNIPTPI